MCLAIDAIDRRDPSNKKRCQLKPKKKDKAILTVYIAAKDALAILYY